MGLLMTGGSNSSGRARSFSAMDLSRAMAWGGGELGVELEDVELGENELEEFELVP